MEEDVKDVKTCQICGARNYKPDGRCPLCGDIIDRAALKRSCIQCGRILFGKEFEKAIDMGGCFSGELVCQACRPKG